MNRRTSPIWIIAALITSLTVGCADAAGGGADAASVTPDAEARRALEADLVEADRQFARSVARHGLAGWINGFTPTGRMVAHGESHIGSEGLRRTMLPVFADSTFEITWDPTFAEVAASGDLGYTVGHFEARSSPDGEPRMETGTYLTVWRLQPDSVWRVQATVRSPAEGPPEG